MAMLTATRVAVSITGLLAEVGTDQEFTNPLPDVVEFVYSFPTDERATLCHFEAEVAGQRIVGVISERQQAAERYDDALACGATALLLEQSRPDKFLMRLGNMAPGATATVHIKYVTTLQQCPIGLRFYLPLALAPRYGATDEQGQTGRRFGPNFLLDFSAFAASGMRFASGPVSPSHPSALRNIVAASDHLRCVTENMECLDKDLVIDLVLADTNAPQLLAEEHPEDRTVACVVSLCPAADIADTLCTSDPCELIFLVDRSGSMECSIANVASALTAFLSQLPENCYFNIVGFGSSYQELFPNSRPADAANIETANDSLRQLRADLGGTVLLDPLQHVLAGVRRAPGLSRRVIVITDGQVSNDEQIFALVRESVTKGREMGQPLSVFSIGIGDSVSHHLVKGLARVGGGTCEVIVNLEEIRAQITQQFRRCLTALALKGISWNLITASGTVDLVVPTDQEPAYLPSHLAPGDRLVVHALFPKMDQRDCAVEARLIVSHPSQPADTIFSVCAQMREGTTVHTLVARELVAQVVRSGTATDALQRKHVTDLAVRHKFVSAFTSFTAVGDSESLPAFAAPPRFVDAQPRSVDTARAYSTSSSDAAWKLAGQVALLPFASQLRRDFNRYSSSEDECCEEIGWRLLHADVFRLPVAPTLLAALVCLGLGLMCLELATILASGSKPLPAVLAMPFGSLPCLSTGAISVAVHGLLTQRQKFNKTAAAGAVIGVALVMSLGSLRATLCHGSCPLSGDFLARAAFCCCAIVASILHGLSNGATLAPSTKVGNHERHIPHFSFIARHGSVTLGAIALGSFAQFVASPTACLGITRRILTGTMLLGASAGLGVVTVTNQLQKEDHRWWWRPFDLTARAAAVWLCLVGSDGVCFCEMATAVTGALVAGAVAFLASLSAVHTMYGMLKID
eukprot:TRINITY_DN13960_c0_g1_i1.p1 TRINITY_DN13960_c0_g1~~TRINITY_DN13960_c0_g1_i1.p1  ORF type:complete len:918 (-),score=111.99 TRINITY_DN13960_c0_g1_i1:19-2772(-)